MLKRKSCGLGAAVLLGAGAGALCQTTAPVRLAGPEAVATAASRAVLVESLGMEGEASNGGVMAGPCDADCPKGAIIEPEPCGQDTNGGCGSVPPAFTGIQGGDTICGTVWAAADDRDTDWYRLVLSSASEVEFCVSTEFVGLIAIVENNGVDDCNGLNGLRLFALTSANCTEVCITMTLPAGTWWFFVSPFEFSDMPCGSGANNYVARLVVGGDDPCNFKGCYADVDGNGTVNSADVGAYLTAYFRCLKDQPPADDCVDCDRNGVCNSADVGCYLTVYFEHLGPCAP